MPDPISAFTDVDAALEPDVFVDFLNQAAAMDGVAEFRRRALDALRLRPGTRVLDLGCGAGDTTAELARLVGANGEAVGVDASEVMVAAAAARFGGLDLPLRFELGDAGALPFDDATFDGVRTERMLCHVPDADAALAEMVRVTRPGGRIAVLDVDLEMTAIDCDDVGFARRLVTAMADSLAHGRIGRELPRRFRTVGLDEVDVQSKLITPTLPILHFLFDTQMAEMQAAGTITAADRGGFWAELEDRAATGRFFVGMAYFLVSGTRP